jgi:ATP-dependent Clp protease ATP-binding subunit ClpC
MQTMRFSAQLRKTIATGRAEAHRLRHPYVGTEHLLLGLIRDPDAIIAAMLSNLGIMPEEIRRRLEEVVVPGKDQTIGPDIPYTSRGKKVLELTMEEAARVGATIADTQHLLPALCAEGKGIAAQLLFDAGVTTDLAREECRRMAAAETSSPVAPPRPKRVMAVTIELRLADGTVRHGTFSSVAAAEEFLNWAKAM